MYSVLITATDIFDTELEDMTIHIPFKDFLQMTDSMHDSQYVRFQLFKETTFVFELSYLQYDSTPTIENAIRAHCKQLVKERRLSRKESKAILRDLFTFQEETPVVVQDEVLEKVSEPTSNEEFIQTVPLDSDKEPATSKKKKTPTLNFRQILYEKRKIMIRSVSIVLFCVIGTFLFLKSNSGAVDNGNQTTFSEDIEYLSPSEMGDKYPDDVAEIEEYYVDSEDFQALRELQEVYPTENGRFDLAFFEEDWKAVIETEASKLTTDRQVMLAHAYIMLNQLDEAEILNKTLKSKLVQSELNAKYLEKGLAYLREQQVSEATALLGKISDTEIKDYLQEYIDTASIMIDMIDYYKSENDPDNVALWERKLDKLGKETMNGTE